MLNLQQKRKNALYKISQNVCKLWIKLLLSDVFNLQKNTFFHFYQTDLVNTKTTIPLRVGGQRWIYTSTLRGISSTTLHLPFAEYLFNFHLVSSFLSVEFRPSTFRKASSRVLSAWPARFCNSSNVIPARAISAGPSWYNWKENAMHIIPAIKTIQSCKTCYSLDRPSLQAWGTNGSRKKKPTKKIVTRRAGNRVHTDFWIQNSRLFPDLFPKQ